MNRPLKGFITYAHKNTTAKDELIMRLDVMQQQNKLVTWHDAEMIGGDKWREEIFKHLADSYILLYLVSAASLASKNCNKELAEAISSDIRIIPIILEDCDWQNHQLSDFQAFPDRGLPINEWQPESKGWQSVVTGIREAVEEMQTSVPKETLPEWVFQQGNFLLTLEQTDKAIEAYSHAITLNPNNAATYTNRGVAYTNKGEFDKAIVDYTKAIKLNPDFTQAYYNRGVAYYEEGEYDPAIKDLGKAIELKSDFAIAYNNRGVVYRDTREYGLAIKDFSKAIELDSDHAEAYNNRGLVYSDKDEHDRAIVDFNKAIELNPQLTEVYNNRGAAYCDKNKYDCAIDDFNKAIELNPDYVSAYNNRGVAYRDKSDYDRAIVDFDKATKLNPRNASSYGNRGVAYHKRGEIDRAIVNYNIALELNPDFVEAYNSRGIAYRDKGDYDRAIADHDKSIELNPDFVEAYNSRAIVYCNKGDYDRAIVDCNIALELNPDYAEAYNSRGIAYRDKGEIDRAIEDLNKAIQLDPQLAEAYSNRGVAYRNKGEVDRAIEDYNKAIELKPKSVEPYNNRGVAYCSKGDYTRAIQDFSKSIELTPRLAVPYNNRGTAYCCEGEYDCAIVDLNKAIQLKPDYAEAYYNRGLAYYKKNDFDLAIEDYTKAIELQPKLADAYANRGEVWLRLEEWDKARADLTTASEKGNDIIASFHNEYESVEAYERRNRVKLPEDIATMLTQRRRSRFPKTEKFLDSDGTPLESPDVFNLLAKLRSAGTPLSQYVQTRPTFGLKTGRQDAFVIDSVTRDQLITEHPSSADILKPFLHGRDIRRWQVARPDSWLIFTCRGIEINRYPAIRKHLEKYRSALSKRAGKQKWYELPATKSDAEHFVQTKLICPNSYDHQTFAVDTEGFYCGDTCYLIPTEETWLCGLLNSRAVEWFYSQTSKQLTGDYLQARSRYMQQIPIPDLTSTQKSLIGKIVDYLIYLQGQPTTSGRDLAHARDAVMLKYFERIIDGLIYEAYLGEELHQGEKQFFKPLLNERLPQLEEIRDDKMSALREIFERLYERTHPVRSNLFFLDSVTSIRIIEGKA